MLFFQAENQVVVSGINHGEKVFCVIKHTVIANGVPRIMLGDGKAMAVEALVLREKYWLLQEGLLNPPEVRVIKTFEGLRQRMARLYGETSLSPDQAAHLRQVLELMGAVFEEEPRPAVNRDLMTLH